MVTAVVGIVGVAVGSLLNFFLQRYAEKRKWEREDKFRDYEERKRAYRELLQGARKAIVQAAEFDSTLANWSVDESTSTTLIALQETTRSIRNIIAEIQILGSPAITGPATDLAIAIENLAISKTEQFMELGQGRLTKTEMNPSEDDEFAETAQERQKDFLNAAKIDLGIVNSK